MTVVSDKTRIGNHLYAVRKQHGLTQAEVAEKACISERTYADIERGKKNMRVDTLCKICNSLRVSPDYLLVENQKENKIDTSEELLFLIEKCTTYDQEIILDLAKTYVSRIIKKD